MECSIDGNNKSKLKLLAKLVEKLIGNAYYLQTWISNPHMHIYQGNKKVPLMSNNLRCIQ